MNGISWSFRDLANHLFPGIIISFPVFYIFREEMGINYETGSIVIFVFLVVSYIVGFTVDSVSKINRWANKAIRLFRADPLKRVFMNYDLRKEIKDPRTFEGIALHLIQKKFGGSLLKNEYKIAIIYYMLREIESRNSFLANFISRISALENMCRNVGFACLIKFLIISTYTMYLEKINIILLPIFFINTFVFIIVAREFYINLLKRFLLQVLIAFKSKKLILKTTISFMNKMKILRKSIRVTCIFIFTVLIIFVFYLGKVIYVFAPLFFLAAGILLLIARDDNRDWFGKVVVRGFVAVNSDNFPLASLSDADPSGLGGPNPSSTPPATEPMISGPRQAGGDDKSPPSVS